MIISLIQELRNRGVPVGMQEVLALAEALEKGLHGNSIEEFYYVARSLLIHDESRYDDFDQVFGYLYKDIPYRSQIFLKDLNDWLQNPLNRPDLTEEEKAALEELNSEELKKLFEERLKEQTERHDGGGYWIGTGGRSPFGTQGYHPSGISLQSGPKNSPGGARSILRAVDARRFRSYREDLVLDVRQIEVALRKLRSFAREGFPSELDLEKSIDQTAKNWGELEVVFKTPRKPNTRVILMMDVGGSMDPYAHYVSQLFSAAKRSTHWKELRTYYFHNCIYGRVYRTDGLRESMRLTDLFRECDSRYKLVFVGDASMAPYELLGDSWALEEESKVSAIEWFVRLKNHFPSAIWLNPELVEGRSFWEGTTVETIASIFPMFPLTLAGLTEGLQSLKRSSL